MVDLMLFRNTRFTVNSIAITVLFFALGGTSFVLSQIYQVVLGYSPLAAGVRALPAALALTIMAPLGTRLAIRYGTRLTVSAGLVTVAGGLVYFATASGHSGYSHYLIASTVMSTGIGLTMSPATQAIVTSLPPAETGVGSAVSGATRNLGTVLGVAVIGSIAATVYAHDTAHTPGQPLAAHLTHHLQTSAAQAFVHGADLGVLMAAVITIAAAAVTACLLPSHASSH